MFKKKLVALSAIMIAGLMTFQANVSADAVEEKPYLSLGADLSASQKSKVLELLGVKENELDQYKVVKVTNKDEHKYLDDYLDSSVIGTHALSSVLIEKRDKGEGIDVTTKNITYCTAGMSNELVVTSKLADQLNDSEKAEQFLALIKEKVLSDDAKTKEDINTIIDECSKDLDVNITDDQREQIAELMQKINKLDLNVNDLKEQASKIYDKLSEMDIDAQGIFAKIKTVLSSIFAALSGLLQ